MRALASFKMFTTTAVSVLVQRGGRRAVAGGPRMSLYRVPPVVLPGTESPAPFFVGVAGGTASGKTCVVERIVEALGDQVAVLPQDCYYRALSQAEREQANGSNFNFDHPSAFDFDRITSSLQALQRGEPHIAVPQYCFVTHSPLPEQHNTVLENPAIIIFEGILALWEPTVRSMLDMKVFVDTDADIRLVRRIRRDIAERGRELDGVLAQYERFVKPSFDAYCAPQRAHADVILPRGVENEVGIQMVIETLRTVCADIQTSRDEFKKANVPVATAPGPGPPSRHINSPAHAAL